ncbi:helix-turn-helix transcriptional regulator [Terricaulis sp.]|uniref:helix-turn-helix transcriptional regulator n=1 Tax=Terricaulis sp. TaxID=2768686 RepID=UPI003782FAE7
MKADYLMTTADVAAYCLLRKNYLERLRCSGGGPAYLKLSARCVAYRREDVEAWLDARRHINTATPAH